MLTTECCLHAQFASGGAATNGGSRLHLPARNVRLASPTRLALNHIRVKKPFSKSTQRLRHMTEHNIILVATADIELLAAWEQALAGFGNVLAVCRFDALKQACVRVPPQILLLDLDLQGLDGPRDVATISNRNPET